MKPMPKEIPNTVIYVRDFFTERFLIEISVKSKELILPDILRWLFPSINRQILSNLWRTFFS